MISTPLSCAQNATRMDKKINNRMTLEQISETVKAALPSGSTLADIDKYFTDNHIEHSFYQKTNQVFAMVHNIKGGHWPVQKDAQIVITLDQAGTLANLEVKPVFTGP
jgi:hypothetical protein